MASIILVLVHVQFQFFYKETNALSLIWETQEQFYIVNQWKILESKNWQSNCPMITNLFDQIREKEYKGQEEKYTV